MARKLANKSLSLLFILIVVFSSMRAFAQSGFDDDRIMIQGFYWESYRHGHPEREDFRKFGDKQWYDIVREKAGTIRDAHFNLVWLPPPSYAGAYSAGYNPKEYFNLSNSYGSFDQHRMMLEELLGNGIEPIADIVINHRDGSAKWADLKNPDWGTWAICKSDEAFTDERSEVKGTPEDQRGQEEDFPTEYTNHGGTTYQYGSFRDISHSNKQVRRDIVKYLKQLQSMGYRGWRYDMVHGYHAKWVALYNRATHPTFSVGEYDWDKHDQMRGWIWWSATTPRDIRTSSNVFDFTTHFTLKNNKATYNAWYGYGNGVGMIGDTTDGIAWKNRSVTFVENQDTGYRTNDDGTPEKGHEQDSFSNGWQVEQAYAYVLTHPGVPCVYWKHFFDWGSDLQNKIRALTNARKVAGVHAGSNLHIQHNAQAKNVYAAMVEGRNGQLYVRIGGGDNEWQPFFSNYRDYREYAYGDGWKVWVKIPENPEVQQAQLASPMPVPAYTPPDTIDVPDDLINQ